MGWIALAALATAFGLVAGRPTHTPPTASEGYAIGTALLVFGVSWAVFMISSLRAKAYRRWHWTLRWAFLGLAGFLAGIIPCAVIASLFEPTPRNPESSALPVGVIGALLVRILMSLF